MRAGRLKPPAPQVLKGEPRSLAHVAEVHDVVTVVAVGPVDSDSLPLIEVTMAS
jgi:hypothetical protein